MFHLPKIRLVGQASFINCQCRYAHAGTYMDKFLNKQSKKKRFEWKSFEPPGSVLLPSPSAISKGPNSNRRVAVLNKLYMKNITDLLATGVCSSRVEGMGLEVTRVKVGAEYNVVNVFWIAHGKFGADIEDVLKIAAAELRQELTGLRLMGKSPVIQFIRDKSVTSWSAVEQLLAVADMGEDYEPRGIASFKDEFGNEKRPVAVKNDKIEEVKSEESKEDEVVESEENKDEETPEIIIELPPMRQNVFNLDRKAILERVLAVKKGQTFSKVFQPGEKVHYEPFDKDTFAKFLLARKITQERMVKNESINREDDVQYEDNDDEPIIDEEDDEPIIDEEDDFLDDDIYDPEREQ